MLGDVVAAVGRRGVEHHDRLAPRSPGPARRAQVVTARAGAVVAVVGHQEEAAPGIAAHGQLADARRGVLHERVGVGLAPQPGQAAVPEWLAEVAPLIGPVDCMRAEAGQPNGAPAVRIAGAEQIDVAVVLDRADVQKARALHHLVEHEAPCLHRVGVEMAQHLIVVAPRMPATHEEHVGPAVGVDALHWDLEAAVARARHAQRGERPVSAGRPPKPRHLKAVGAARVRHRNRVVEQGAAAPNHGPTAKHQRGVAEQEVQPPPALEAHAEVGPRHAETAIRAIVQLVDPALPRRRH